MYRHYSTYVVTVITAVFAYWLQLPLDQQAAILDQFPTLKMIAPGIGFISFMISRCIPQSQQTQEQKQAQEYEDEQNA